MAIAWLVTLLAIGGVVAGVLTGQARTLSLSLAAAGGGLLTGIALFWLLPEIAEKSGWPLALLIALTAGAAMFALDHFLAHGSHATAHSVVLPLLIAAAIHSFLDGWSVRAFLDRPIANVAIPAGLALHKIPEGLALGWITQKTAGARKAMAGSAAAECMTLVGAFVQPRANQSAVAVFGDWWTAGVLAVIAGSFLFLGLHVLWPDWRRPRVAAVFVGALAITGFIRA